MYTDTPVPVGASKMPSRAALEGRTSLEGRTYRHQPYPSVRFHPDGRTVTVRDAKEDAAYDKPWSAKPYPPPVVVPPPPEPSRAELKQQVAALRAERDQLQQENNDLKAYISEQMTERAQRSRKTRNTPETAA